VICLDPFHIVKAATDALDKIRREVWNEARRQGQTQLAKDLKGARFALWKNPENLTQRQQLKLARIQQLNQRLYRAYLLAQQLRQIYRVPAEHALVLLEAWLKWARRCRLEPFVKLASRITEQRPRVEAAITNKLSNAAVEQVNTQIRLITRRGFGYHSPWAVIALAMLSLAGLCPPLPGR
jgi:transposase